MAMANHCVTVNECPKVATDNKIVTNFRVVVIVVVITGVYHLLIII